MSTDGRPDGVRLRGTKPRGRAFVRQGRGAPPERISAALRVVYGVVGAGGLALQLVTPANPFGRVFLLLGSVAMLYMGATGRTPEGWK